MKNANTNEKMQMRQDIRQPSSCLCLCMLYLACRLAVETGHWTQAGTTTEVLSLALLLSLLVLVLADCRCGLPMKTASNTK
jgi:hypothetical protein